MSRLPLTLACWNYDRVAALQDGRVQVEGVDLRFISLPIEELFFRVFKSQEFDVTELSLSAYMMAHVKGPWHYRPIPVFLSRMFRHSAIFVRRDGSIKAPADLKGKRVGVPEYTQTAGMTARGILEDDFGVKPSDMEWFNGGLEEPGREEKFAFNLPPGVKVTYATGKALAQMLVAGEIDALISARNPSGFKPNGPIVRLFDNHRSIERDYYKRTGVHPIMHMVGVRSALLDAHPWLAASLVKAFTQAKNLCLADIDGTGGTVRATIPWMCEEVDETRELMGDDWWPYGLERNRAALTAAARWSFNQGLTSRQVTPEELFPASTHGEFKV
jgi:4,5-dihydroxyphthalate decarboxylase